MEELASPRSKIAFLTQENDTGIRDGRLELAHMDTY